MNANFHAHTPDVAVIDSRGLPVRQIAYWRRADEKRVPETRVTVLEHDAAGRTIAWIDPRLAVANLSSVINLSGTALLTDSVDAGWHLSLYGDSGQSLERWDQRGSYWLTEHDNQLRPVVLRERMVNQSLQTIERITYAEAGPRTAAHNQCGRRVRHDDPAGTLLMNDYGLIDVLLSQTRHFLKDLDPPDWPQSLPERDKLLETAEERHTTTWAFDGTGALLALTDAKYNRQTFAYALSGELKNASLYLDGLGSHPVAQDIHYNAMGLVESQTAGNGVIKKAIFDPSDGRLQQLSALHSGRPPLQDMHYDYDPVGNVLRVQDLAQPVRHYAGQRITAQSTYLYDTLYRLTCATGREALGAAIQPGLPELAPNPGDTSQLLNYTQHYEYDHGDNLIRLRHEGAHPGQPATHVFKIDPGSNRGLPWHEGDPDPDFARHFDANGNLRELQPGQALQWNARNRLQKIVSVSRTSGDDDERYIYDTDGLRVRKLQTSKAGAVTHLRQVRYLPGLEIRTLDDTQQLHVVVLQTGLDPVRCLHWHKGQPSGIDNDQYRYSLNDHLASCCMELDDQARLISHEGYYPFGGTAWWAARSAVEADSKTVRFSGKERDTSGLYYYGLRYYAPWMMRWLNPDPVQRPQGLNIYGFCANNPVNRTDDDGQMWQPTHAPMELDAILDEYLDHEQDLIATYPPGTTAPAVRAPPDDTNDPMSDSDDAQSDHSSNASSPGSPGSPASVAALGDPTPEQQDVANMMRRTMRGGYHLNNRNLLARHNFGGVVFRADRRTPHEIDRLGFNASDEFTSIPKMITGSTLIVAETLDGALFYAANGSDYYHFYEIEVDDVHGASLLENLVLNLDQMSSHINQSSRDLDQDISGLTGEADYMREAHISLDDLVSLNKTIRPLGQLKQQVAAMKVLHGL